jgi:hypothetical protein
MREIYQLVYRWLQENKVRIIRQEAGMDNSAPLLYVGHIWIEGGRRHSTTCKILFVGPHHLMIANDFPGSDAQAIQRSGVYRFNLADPADWKRFCKSFGVEV